MIQLLIQSVLVVPTNVLWCHLPRISFTLINFLLLQNCHKFKEIWLPLLSVPQLCKNKLTVTFKGETVEVSDSDGNVLITGFLDPVKGLFMAPIDDLAEEQRVKE